MSSLKVVNYEKMERLRPPPITTIPFNLNTLSIIVIIFSVLLLFKRSVDVKQSRERSRT